MRAFTALVAAALAAGAARGHPLDLASLDVRIEGASVRATLDLSVEVAEQLVGDPPRTLRSNEAAGAAAARIFRATLGSGQLLADGAPCAAGAPSASVEALRLRIAAELRCPHPIRELRWSFPFVEATALDYRVIVKATSPSAEERSYVLEPGATTLRIAAGGDRSFATFVSMGVRHIGAHPAEWRGEKGLRIAPGIDHILFVVALILAGGGLWRTLATVTGFTVGHSITLAVASFGLLTLPAKPVEVAIAASIVYVALRDVFAREPSKHGFAIAAAFGLVHGFGFASALEELKLSRTHLASALLGFNLGVELGQAAIVAVLAPVFVLLRRRPWFTSTGMKVIASAIAAAGLFWLVQRIVT